MKSIASLTSAQLRRAAEIKEQIQSLNNELNRIFVGPATTATTATTTTTAAAGAPQVGQVRGKMSPAAKAKLSAKLKAYWAKRKAAAAAPQAGQVKGKMSPAAKALLSAKLKAYWAKRKAAQKK